MVFVALSLQRLRDSLGFASANHHSLTADGVRHQHGPNASYHDAVTPLVYICGVAVPGPDECAREADFALLVHREDRHSPSYVCSILLPPDHLPRSHHYRRTRPPTDSHETRPQSRYPEALPCRDGREKDELVIGGHPSNRSSQDRPVYTPA